MPIWLRKLTFRMIEKHYDDEKEAIERSQNKQKATVENTRPLGPAISTPTYSTKVARK